MSEQLYYHKCNDCLTPFSSTERHVDRCDCDGAVTFMGAVHGVKYVQTGTKPACDGRCTNACGPSCDCACNGANHGTGRVVQTIIKEGKIKVVSASDDVSEDMLRGYKFRDFRDYARKLCNETTDKWVAYRMNRELDKIVAMRVYDPRMNALVAFMGKYKK